MTGGLGWVRPKYPGRRPPSLCDAVRLCLYRLSGAPITAAPRQNNTALSESAGSGRRVPRGGGADWWREDGPTRDWWDTAPGSDAASPPRPTPVGRGREGGMEGRGGEGETQTVEDCESVGKTGSSRAVIPADPLLMGQMRREVLGGRQRRQKRQEVLDWSQAADRQWEWEWAAGQT